MRTMMRCWRCGEEHQLHQRQRWSKSLRRDHSKYQRKALESLRFGSSPPLLGEVEGRWLRDLRRFPRPPASSFGRPLWLSLPASGCRLPTARALVAFRSKGKG